jgi:hypothetical protein
MSDGSALFAANCRHLRLRTRTGGCQRRTILWAEENPARYHFTSSTRRFFALPSSVSFDATGA